MRIIVYINCLTFLSYILLLTHDYAASQFAPSPVGYAPPPVQPIPVIYNYNYICYYQPNLCFPPYDPYISATARGAAGGLPSFQVPLLRRLLPLFAFLATSYYVLSTTSTTTTTTTTTAGCASIPNNVALGLTCCPEVAVAGNVCENEAQCTAVVSGCIFDCAAFNGDQTKCDGTNQCTYNTILSVCAT